MMDLSKTLEYYYKLIHDALLAKIEGNVRYVLGKSLSLCLLKANNQPLFSNKRFMPNLMPYKNASKFAIF